MVSLVWQFFVGPIIGFALGGFPTSFIICKIVKGVDPRTVGSFSVSTRNVIRVTGSRWWGMLNGIVDTLKGAAACALVEFVICYNFSSDIYHPNIDYIVSLTGLAAVAGHNWMPYLGFKGGKGLATMSGIIMYLYWPIGPIVFPISIALMSTYSGFSAVGAVWSSTLISPLFFITDRIPNSQIINPIPHPFLETGLYPFDIPFTILFGFGIVVILVLRYIPEFRKIKAGEAKIWEKLSDENFLK